MISSCHGNWIGHSLSQSQQRPSIPEAWTFGRQLIPSVIHSFLFVLILPLFITSPSLLPAVPSLVHGRSSSFLHVITTLIRAWKSLVPCAWIICFLKLWKLSIIDRDKREGDLKSCT